MLDPATNEKAFNFFTLAGRRSPGVCKFSFPTKKYGWEAVKAKGSDGAESILNGDELAEFDAELTLWKDYWVDHYDGWKKWKGVLVKSTKNNIVALDIYHPQLDDLGIKSVVLKGRSSPQSTGPGGASIVRLSFLEYAPPKKRQGSGKPAGSAAPGDPQIQRLMEDIEKSNMDLKRRIEKQREFAERQARGERVTAAEMLDVVIGG